MAASSRGWGTRSCRWSLSTVSTSGVPPEDPGKTRRAAVRVPLEQPLYLHGYARGRAAPGEIPQEVEAETVRGLALTSLVPDEFRADQPARPGHGGRHRRGAVDRTQRRDRLDGLLHERHRAFSSRAQSPRRGWPKWVTKAINELGFNARVLKTRTPWTLIS